MKDNRVMQLFLRIAFLMFWVMPLIRIADYSALGATLRPEFVAILNGNPEVSYFKIGFPGDLFIVNDKPIEGRIYYEGSIQQNTFWVRNCAQSPPLSGHMMPGWFLGMSFDEYWNYRDPSVTVSARGSLNSSPLDLRVEQVRAWVLKVLGIGVMIKPGSFVLKSDNSFEAEELNQDGKIIGAFEVNDAGFPTRCEFRVTSQPLGRAVVEYSYAEQRITRMPVTTRNRVFKGPLKMFETDYTIEKCEFGRAIMPTNGFTVDYMTNFGSVDLRY